MQPQAPGLRLKRDLRGNESVTAQKPQPGLNPTATQSETGLYESERLMRGMRCRCGDGWESSGEGEGGRDVTAGQEGAAGSAPTAGLVMMKYMS